MASGNTLVGFTARDGEPPATNSPIIDSRNNIWVAGFDAATEESFILRDILPSHYSGGGLTIDIYWMAATATSGGVVWGASIERAQEGGTDQDADSFATEQLSAAVTTNAVSGVKNKSTVTIAAGAAMDNLAANEPFRLKIARKVANAGDTMTGDAQLTDVHIKET